MPADVINLNRARKARERAEKDQRAAENRVKFGRTKAERKERQAIEDLARRRHEALRLEQAPSSRERRKPGGAGSTSENIGNRGDEPDA